MANLTIILSFWGCNNYLQFSKMTTLEVIIAPTFKRGHLANDFDGILYSGMLARPKSTIYCLRSTENKRAVRPWIAHLSKDAKDQTHLKKPDSLKLWK